jgi:ammonium transporter, Amt family
VSWAVFAALGFVPGFVASYVLKLFGLLRITRGAEIAGLDLVEIPLKPYPEGLTPSTTGNGHASGKGHPVSQAAPAE